MLIVIAGAGNVGRAIARDLLKNGHEVTVIDEDPDAIASAKKSGAKTVLADACEPDSLDEANLARYLIEHEKCKYKAIMGASNCFHQD